MSLIAATRRLTTCIALLALGTGVSCGEPTTDTQPDPETTTETTTEPEPEAPRLGLNDVSVLIPLPTSLDDPGYLVPLSQGLKGELLPKAVFDEIPVFPVTPSEGLNYVRMRTLAIRFDGCQPKETGCEAQIRMVMQPIKNDGKARDSALHLFYSLTAEELPELVGELRRLQTLAPEVADAPLDVHAALVAQGVTGAYGAALNEVVLRFAGEQNLTRMTFFLRAPPTLEVWFFGGFERSDGALEVMDIALLGKANQQVIRTEIEGGYDFAVNPVSSTPVAERVLLTSALAAAATPEERETAFAKYVRIQNPRHFKADELSCAGCHLGTFIQAQTEAAHGLDATAFPDDLFTSSHDLTLRGGAAQNGSSLRAFGWFGNEPMIARRVVNESAEVVDDLELRFPPAP